MKHSVGFIAIGQAGGNIGKIFERKGYSVFYINTSQEDLDTLKDTKFKYHIKGGEGCNKNRNKSKEILQQDFENIVTSIKSKITEQIIYLIFSSGGGTGSGAAPLLIDILSQTLEDKTIGAITILPAENESLKAHINAYECFQELEEVENIASTFVLDNNKKDMLALNNNFVELFDSMLEIPRYKDIRGNIDTSEIKEMLRTRGSFVICKINKTNGSSIKLLESLKNSIFAPLENDNVVKYVALSMASKIDIEDIKREVGNFLDIYKGYNTNHTICLLSGLSYPISRLVEIRNKVIENKEDIQRNIKEPLESKLKQNIDFLNDTTVKTKKSSIDKKNIFAKFMKKS